jgi:hypothetical protein
MEPSPKIKSFVLIVTHRGHVFAGEYWGEDARYLFLRSARKITPDLVAANMASTIAKYGVAGPLPASSDRWIPLSDVSEIMAVDPVAMMTIIEAKPNQPGKVETWERNFLRRAAHAAVGGLNIETNDKNPYQDTFGT